MRYLRDPGYDIWARDLVTNIFNDVQQDLQVRTGVLEDVTVLRHAPRYDFAVTYEWELDYVPAGKTARLCLRQHPATGGAYSYAWEAQQRQGIAGDIADTGTQFTHLWEAWTVGDPGQAVPIPFPTNHRSTKLIAYDQLPLEYEAKEVIMKNDNSYLSHEGQPVAYYREGQFDKTFIPYPRPPIVDQQDIESSPPHPRPSVMYTHEWEAEDHAKRMPGYNNLAAYPEAFDENQSLGSDLAARWFVSGVTITADQFEDRNGRKTADLYVSDGMANRFIQQSRTVIANQDVTFSVDIKLVNGYEPSTNAQVILAVYGAIGGINTTNIGRQLNKDDYVRVSFTATTDGSGGKVNFQIRTDELASLALSKAKIEIGNVATPFDSPNSDRARFGFFDSVTKRQHVFRWEAGASDDRDDMIRAMWGFEHDHKPDGYGGVVAISSDDVDENDDRGTFNVRSGSLVSQELGMTIDVLDETDAYLLIYDIEPDDMDDGADESNFPPFLQKYIEHGTLSRAYGANTDGRIQSLADYWRFRYQVGLEVIKRYHGSRTAKRTYRLRTHSVQPSRRTRHPRLPSSYPSI